MLGLVARVVVAGACPLFATSKGKVDIHHTHLWWNRYKALIQAKALKYIHIKRTANAHRFSSPFDLKRCQFIALNAVRIY